MGIFFYIKSFIVTQTEGNASVGNGGADCFAKISIIEFLFKAIIVNTPRIVPNGIKIHSTPAMIMQKMRFLCCFSLLPASIIHIARLQPRIINIDPMITNIHPKKGGGPEPLLS